ncbi:hypothetical protein N9Y67_00135 [Pseudomonadota bacterium]|nr:hypothetical protein [Pseudomonadota bacterium]
MDDLLYQLMKMPKDVLGLLTAVVICLIKGIQDKDRATSIVLNVALAGFAAPAIMLHFYPEGSAYLYCTTSTAVALYVDEINLMIGNTITTTIPDLIKKWGGE